MLSISFSQLFALEKKVHSNVTIGVNEIATEKALALFGFCIIVCMFFYICLAEKKQQESKKELRKARRFHRLRLARMRKFIPENNDVVVVKSQKKKTAIVRI